MTYNFLMMFGFRYEVYIQRRDLCVMDFLLSEPSSSRFWIYVLLIFNSLIYELKLLVKFTSKYAYNKMAKMAYFWYC